MQLIIIRIRSLSNSVNYKKNVICQFQGKYSWFYNLNMEIKSWKYESTNITASSIRLCGASWEVNGVNLIIKDSYLTNFKLIFSGSSPHLNGQLEYRGNLTFLNTFYSFQTILAKSH